MSTQPQRPPFDSNRAWTEATGLVSGNRDLLIALAGVFLVVPSFAISMLLPPPEAQDGAQLEAMLATMGAYYRTNSITLILVALFQMIGSLSMLALFTDARRPTVGEAIRQGFRYTPTAIAAQLILGMAIGAMVLLPVTLGGATKSPVFTALSLIVAAGLGIWAMVRLSLVAPAVVVDRLANPIHALQRSWRLTEGNALRLLAFFVLVLIGFGVLLLVGEGATRLVLTLLAGAATADLVALAVATVLQAAMSVYFVAISAACHRQLAGASAQSVVDKFE
ncbi:MAG: hypothetical protein U1E37_07510 [Sphingomonadaceae bacterium]